MLKLLIVDDEKIILNGVRFLIEKKKKFPFEVDITTASSGVAALDILDVFVPDLILTDIRMPVMDGFAFIERVREKEIECDIVILTSHADFSYAKKAISFHVEDFLLKPIQAEELEKVLKNSYRKVEVRKQEEEREGLSMVRNMLLYDIFSDQLSMDSTLLSRIFPYQYYTVVLVETEESQHDHTRVLEEEMAYFYPVCKTFWFYQKKHYVTVCNHDRFFTDTNSLGWNLEKVFLKEKYRYSVSISSNSWTELHSLYMNAQLRILCGKMYEQQGEMASLSFITYRECVDILTENNPEIIKGKLGSYLDKIFSQYPDSLSLRQEAGSIFVQNCNMYLENLGAELIHDSFEDREISSREELIGLIERLLQVYRNQKSVQDNLGSEPENVTKLIAYIDANYDKDISLEILADEMGMHPNYICTLLKRHLGEPYLTYLQRVRIQAAKRLIQDFSHYNLQEIAERVGLKSAGQLIRTFKKIENMTPGEYKKLLD